MAILKESLDAPLITKGLDDAVRRLAANPSLMPSSVTLPGYPSAIGGKLLEEFREEHEIEFPGMKRKVKVRVARNGLALIPIHELGRIEGAARGEIARLEKKARDAFQEGAESISAALGEGAL